MNRVSKLVLGTVQFGCQYGINSEGRPSSDQVRDILDYASFKGIHILDTSSAYGNAEDILGKLNANNKFKIVGKYPKSAESVEKTFNRTSRTLGTSHLYGYLIHHFDVYQNNKSIWNEFVRLQETQRVEKIGFSLYEPRELDTILEDRIPFSLIQIPYNILDRKFEPYFEHLKSMEVEIHVRSTFLQGLFFKDRNTLPKKLKPLENCLNQLDRYAADLGISIGELALSHNIQNPCIDGVLIGVDNKKQLIKDIESIKDVNIDLNISVENPELLKPVNWL